MKTRSYPPVLLPLALILIAAGLPPGPARVQAAAPAAREAPSAPLPPRAYLPFVTESQGTFARPPAARGGPVARAAVDQWHWWYLPPDGQIVDRGYAVEPFPLDPTLGIRDLAAYGDGLVAATDAGLYARDAATRRWRKISELAASRVATYVEPGYMDDLWIVPANAPEQVWHSVDGGQTWARADAGLQGPVVGPLTVEYMFGLFAHTATVVDGQYVVWEASLGWAGGAAVWRPLARVPGPALPWQPGSLPASFEVTFNGAGLQLLAGSADGHVYRLFPMRGAYDPEAWEPVADFGAGKYPLLLGPDLSLVDVDSGEMQFYTSPGVAGFDPPTWWAAPFPQPGAPWGAYPLPNGEAAARVQGAWFLSLALSHGGSLYASQPDRPHSWRLVTPAPERTHFLVSAVAYTETVGVSLYSGGRLSWDGTACAGDGAGFYRSSDYGLTWATVATGTVRLPVAVVAHNDHDHLLALTCAGPALSNDGGGTWRDPPALGWPAGTSARFAALGTGYDETRGAWFVPGFYAGGVAADGHGYLYQATYDEASGRVGPWTDITPPALKETGNPPVFLTVRDFADPAYLYVAGRTGGLWVSTDAGATWTDLAAGLGSARVRGLMDYGGSQGSGLLAATDQGLFYGPWQAGATTWTPAPGRFPVDLDGFEGGMLVGGGYAYPLPFDGYPGADG